MNVPCPQPKHRGEVHTMWLARIGKQSEDFSISLDTNFMAYAGMKKTLRQEF
jgi:hypothetical protein